MSLKLGNTTINKVYLGSNEINKLYLGNTEVFGNAPAPGGELASLVAVYDSNSIVSASNLEGANVTSWVDSVGGNDLSIVGQPVLHIDSVSGAKQVRFNGVDNRLVAADGGIHNFIGGTNPFTIIVKFGETVPDSASEFVGKLYINGGSCQYGIVSTPSTTRWQFIVGGTAVTQFSDTPLPNEVAAISADLTDYRSYIEGVEVKTNPVGTYQSGLAIFAVGGRSNAFVAGDVQSIRIYNEALTEAQIISETTKILPQAVNELLTESNAAATSTYEGNTLGSWSNSFYGTVETTDVNGSTYALKMTRGGSTFSNMRLNLVGEIGDVITFSFDILCNTQNEQTVSLGGTDNNANFLANGSQPLTYTSYTRTVTLTSTNFYIQLGGSGAGGVSTDTITIDNLSILKTIPIDFYTFDNAVGPNDSNLNTGWNGTSTFFVNSMVSTDVGQNFSIGIETRNDGADGSNIQHVLPDLTIGTPYKAIIRYKNTATITPVTNPFIAWQGTTATTYPTAFSSGDWTEVEVLFTPTIVNVGARIYPHWTSGGRTTGDLLEISSFKIVEA